MIISNDKRLQADVMNELKWEPSVDAAHIGVSAQDGAVTLNGHVPNYAVKTRAVKAAERVFGVRAVADEIEVRLPSSQKHDDSTIAEAIAQSLTWDVDVPSNVDAEVAKGWVTLRGKVDSHYQKQAAERAVRSKAGVRGVSNVIEVSKQAKTADIQGLISAAFQRNAALDARRIQVTSDDSTVHLYGTVHSVSEVRAAREAAYSAPGVSRVDDQLVVSP